MHSMDREAVKYVVRVYALIVNEKLEILLSDEYRQGMKMVKFPGGGMQHGEGTLECLQREAMEEFGFELVDVRHYYTTDFYQKAWFFRDHQLLSIYYRAGLPRGAGFRASQKAFDFPGPAEGSQSFRWAALSDLEEDDLTFPVDRKVLEILKADPAVQIREAGS